MTDTDVTLRDRYVGAMLGSALGDALGKLTEHIDYDAIVHQFGRDGIVEPPVNALYTDDTQMAMATAEALVRSGGATLADDIREVTVEYLRWYERQNSPVHRRAPGVAVIDALARIQRGTAYSAASDGGANDSIVATRVHPIALRYHGDVARVVETAAEVGRMTHGSPAAVSSAAAAALFVDYALSDEAPETWLRGYVSHLRRWCPDRPTATIEAIRTTESTLGWDAEDAMERHFHSRPGYGGGWTGEETVGIGLWCFLTEPKDFVATVRLGANAYGESDTDSIAAFAGALSGAFNGVGAIPQDWIARLEDHEKLRSLGEQLYELHVGS